MADATTKHPNRYGPTNEPKSRDEAENRLDQLELDVNRMEGHLSDRSRIGLFDSRSEYDAWRKGAEKALYHSQQEQRFLEKWIEEDSPREIVGLEFTGQTKRMNITQLALRLGDTLDRAGVELDEVDATELKWLRLKQQG